MSPNFFSWFFFYLQRFFSLQRVPCGPSHFGIRLGKNVLTIAFQLELTPFICMICAKVKLIRSRADWGKAGYWFLRNHCEISGGSQRTRFVFFEQMQVYVENVSYLICLLTLVNTLEPDERLRFKRPNNGHITLREVDKKTARASAGPFRKFV